MVRWSVKPVDEGVAMHWISQANIDGLKLLLETEPNEGGNGHLPSYRGGDEAAQA